MTSAIDPTRHRVRRFVERVARLTEPDWGFVCSKWRDGEWQLAATESVSETINIAGRGPTPALKELDAEARRSLDLLREDAAFAEMARRVAGPDGADRLIRIAEDAAYGLLVSNLGDWKLGEATISPRTAAAALYRPFEDVIPPSSLG